MAKKKKHRLGAGTPTSPTRTAGEAVAKLVQADTVEGQARAGNDPVLYSEARRYREAGEAALRLDERPPEGASGELIVKDYDLPNEETGHMQDWIKETLKDPDWVNATASRERMELAQGAWSLELAIDTADSIQAENSLERMLAHQMAALHGATMKIMGELHTELENRPDFNYGDNRDLARNIELTRLANSSARLSETFQKGIEQIRKLRTGGKQTIVVQHVHVSDGGQANVAGSVERPSRDQIEGKGG